MKLHLFKPSSLGISAMVLAVSSYAGAQTTPRAMEQPVPPVAQQQAQNLKLVSTDARLTHDLNARNAAQGQKVTAKLSSDVKAANGIKLDKGTVLTGKVEQVQKSNDNGPSRISIVLNQARLKDGRTIPVKTTLLGAYPSSSGDYYADSGTNGALIAGQPHSIGPDKTIDQEPGTLSHVAMESAVQSNASGTFTSNDGDVNLKRGTKLQIAIAPMTGSNGSAG